ncbi:response regulator, partial [Achromobacter sp. DMS1]|uniref:response regulator n=1 Tax=Achromobacter sp. DMS1 TaxID=1688405 RepID=UPI000A960245
MPRLRPRFARRILVLNDHPVELALFQNMLAAMGYRRVIAASDAAATVAAVARQPHDVVISDIATGIAGSASLLTELRGMGRVPPVIWTSGLGEELLQSHVRLALEAGSASVQALPMPVSAAVLQAAMETALESLAASQEA